MCHDQAAFDFDQNVSPNLPKFQTAVRLKLKITVIVFRDGGYNMAAFQQTLIYRRTSEPSLEIPTS
jgi:thiamine pyrophosphate-dependent acetolactate synthase large subunit-like protein